MITDMIKTWNQRSKTRFVMRQMNGRQLEDIGLNQEQVRTEADKYFWEA